MIFKYLNKGFQYLVFTNLLIALAAASQSAMSYLVFDQSIDFNVVFVEWSSTLLLYNFTLYLSLPQNTYDSPFLRTKWVGSHRFAFGLITIFAIFVFCYFVLQLHLKSMVFLIMVAGIALLYVLPVYRRNGKWIGLRQFPGLKVFHIALVWVMSTVFLPFVELSANGIAVHKGFAIVVALSRFLFLLVCTLPFDIRDMEADRQYGLRTLPLMIGENKAKALVYLLLLVHSCWVLTLPVYFEGKAGFLISNILVLFISKEIVFKRKNYYDVYLLDLMLVFQFLFVCISLLFF